MRSRPPRWWRSRAADARSPSRGGEDRLRRIRPAPAAFHPVPGAFYPVCHAGDPASSGCHRANGARGSEDLLHGERCGGAGVERAWDGAGSGGAGSGGAGGARTVRMRVLCGCACCAGARAVRVRVAAPGPRCPSRAGDPASCGCDRAFAPCASEDSLCEQRPATARDGPRRPATASCGEPRPTTARRRTTARERRRPAPPKRARACELDARSGQKRSNRRPSGLDGRNMKTSTTRPPT